MDAEHTAAGIVRALRSSKASVYCHAEAFTRQMAFDWRSKGSPDLIVAVLRAIGEAGIEEILPSVITLAKQPARGEEAKCVQAAAEECILRLQECELRRAQSANCEREST